MTPRVTTGMLVSALVRKAEAEGGFAAVLSKGDATAGSLILVICERGAAPWILERILQPDGRYGWDGSRTQSPEEVPALVARRRRVDPDLWVLELDVPHPERFAAELDRFD